MTDNNHEYCQGQVMVLAATHEPYDNRVYFKEALSLLKKFSKLIMITPEGSAFQPAQGITLKRYASRSGRWNRIKSLYQTALEYDAAVCHCHEPDSLLAGVWYKQKKGCKLIYDSHEYHPESFAERFPKAFRGIVRSLTLSFERWMVKHCDYVITVNEELAEKFSSWGAKVAILPNYPSPEIFESTNAAKRIDKVIRLLYVGTLSKTRGVLDVLDVARRVQLQGKEVKVTIAGVSNDQDFNQELETYAKKHQLNVEMLGHVPHNQIPATIAESNIGMLLLHPLERYTKAEPIKLFEYMACGLPVLSYDYPAVRGIISDNQCGEMVEALDLDACAKAILKMANDEEYRFCLGQNGKKAFELKYNWAVCEKRLSEVYEQLGMRCNFV